MTKESGKPNILLIMGDDIGWFNLSCYNHGVMGSASFTVDQIVEKLMPRG